MSVLTYTATFVAGGLAWEVIRLGAMNQADREDLVTQMIDAQQRAHPIDYPAIHLTFGPTLRDHLKAQASAEFERCGGRPVKPASADFFAPLWEADIFIHDYDRRKEDRHRAEMAAINSVFTLRRVQICRSFGGCGPDLPASVKRPSPLLSAWDSENEKTSFVPTTLANAEPFVLSLACGMGLREKLGLPAYPNQARLEADDKAWQADRTRRCAKGDQTACL